MEKEAVAPQETIAALAAFSGFAAEDFDIFSVPDFADRMPRLKQRLTPKLAQAGELLSPRLSEALEETLFPHVAQHLRRSVHPAEETWVAFSRSARSYKPFVHLRAAISAERARVVVFIEEDAEDKMRFAANLEHNAEPLALYLAHHPAILGFDLRDESGEPKRGSALDADALTHFAQRMQRVRGQHAAFGMVFAQTHPVLASGPEFIEAVTEAAAVLRPLYECGTISDFEYLYTPEVIVGL